MKNLDEQRQIAITIAREAHEGQYRRDGKTLYINHVYDVYYRVKHLGVKYGIVSILHDVIEDSYYSFYDIVNAGIDKELVEAVVVLTKSDGIEYMDYLQNVAMNPIAKQVKIADMLSNLSDSPTKRQVAKYSKGLAFLLGLDRKI